MKTIFWILLILATLLQPAQADNKTLRIATGELPPYATAARPDRGIALSIARRAFELAGYKVKYTFLPWSRALIESKAGKWDGTAYWGHKPEHEKSFYLSDNVVTEQWVFIYRNGINLAWRTLEDLHPYQIAIIPNYTYTPALWAMVKSGRLKADITRDDLAVLRKLLAGRVDIAPMERNVACDLLGHNFTEDEANRLRAYPRLMTDKFTTHLMLPRQLPDSRARIMAFNIGLKKLYESGEHAKLLSQVRCPNSWSEIAAPSSK